MDRKAAHPALVVFGILFASGIACSSVFAEDTKAPQPNPPVGVSAETQAELDAVTGASRKSAEPAQNKANRARKQWKRPRYNPEDVGC